MYEHESEVQWTVLIRRKREPTKKTFNRNSNSGESTLMNELWNAIEKNNMEGNKIHNNNLILNNQTSAKSSNTASDLFLRIQPLPSSPFNPTQMSILAHVEQVKGWPNIWSAVLPGRCLIFSQRDEGER